MTDTRLNLLAIAVFLMTLSVLVGPVVHLSPVIPAAVTLGVMGLATVDQLGREGKGTDWVVSWFLSKAERQRLACHEAGHFLVAYLLQIPVTAYQLRGGSGGFGGVTFDTQALEAASHHFKTRPQALDRWATVWMAGIAAEMLTYGQDQGGQGDRHQLRQVFRLAGLSPQHLPLKERWALLQVKTLLQSHSQAHQSLQQALTDGRSLEDCYDLLKNLIPNGSEVA